MTFLFAQDCFIVDQGAAGLWVWVGKGASKVERAESMNNAMVSTHVTNCVYRITINKRAGHVGKGRGCIQSLMVILLYCGTYYWKGAFIVIQQIG